MGHDQFTPVETPHGSTDHESTVVHDGDDASLGAVSTEKALNSAIGDSVNYIDPMWFILSDWKMTHINSFPSLDGYTQSTSGSGTINIIVGGDSIEVDSGSTDGSEARLTVGNLDNVDRWTFDKNIQSEFTVRWANVHENLYVTFGRFTLAGKTNAHVGVGVESGDLIGTVADKSSRSTTTLITGLSDFDEHEIRINHKPGSEVVFVVDGTQQGTISSNLPTGGIPTNADRGITLAVENADSSASRSRLFLEETTIVQEP